MAGHSKFKNIMHRKGAQDKKRAKTFTKIIREITVAAKQGGGSVDSNPRLRSAIIAARGVNMPSDNIERALKKALGGDGDTDYQEVRYEGYGPGGIAVIVEVLTDNRNRSAADVRSSFNRYGGALGETGSVSFQFKRQGVITYPASAASDETMFEAALEAGAQDVSSSPEEHIITCQMEDLMGVQEHLSKTFGDPVSAELSWDPLNTVDISLDTARSLMKLLDALEDLDDVQKVFSNEVMSEDVETALEA